MEGGQPVSGLQAREARLKPEFAHLYPSLEAGRWDSAAMMADRVVAWLLRQPHGGYISPDRVLRPEHFEFRGSSPRPGSRPEGQNRRGDSGKA
jgi:hypothetical protein